MTHGAPDSHRGFASHGVLVVAACLLLAVVSTSCVTAPMEINPVYATRSVRQVTGEILLGEVSYDGDDSSMGAVRPVDPLPYYCREALAQEFEAFGLTVDKGAPLRVDVDIRQAETEWRNQGEGGVFTTTFVIAFSVTDRDDHAVYERIHRGVASHNQSYGGYPASAAFTEALATSYERFLQDPELLQALKAGGAVNLFGDVAAPVPSDLADRPFRDYTDALSALAPHLTEGLESQKFDEVFGIVGFPNNEANLSSLSDALAVSLRDLLVSHRYQVVTRDLKDVLWEQELQLSGIVDESTVVEVGRIAGATRLITGALTHQPEAGAIRWDLHLLDVETGITAAAFTLYLLASEQHLRMLEHSD